MLKSVIGEHSIDIESNLYYIGFGATPTPGAFGAQPAANTGAFGQPAQQSAFGAAPAAGKNNNTHVVHVVHRN